MKLILIMINIFLLIIWFVISEIYNYMRQNMILKRAGERISSKTSKEYFVKKIIPLLAISLNYWVIGIIDKPYILYIFMMIIVYIFFLSIGFYKKTNGIYENGIIHNEYIEWSKVISYYFFDKDKITFFINIRKRNNEVEMRMLSKEIDNINKLLRDKNVRYKNLYDLA